MLENYSQVLGRNTALFNEAKHGILMDCASLDVLAALPDTFRGFTTSHAVYQQDRSDRMSIGVVPPEDTTFDSAIVLMPKSKLELAFRIDWLRAHLNSGASVFLLGAKKEGIASGAKMLSELGGKPLKVDMARHCQLWQVTLTSTKEVFSLSDWETITPIETALGTIKLCGLPGVFNSGGLDKGTEVLLNSLAGYFLQLQERNKPIQSNLLDFACGAGVIGALMKLRFPELEVSGVDNSELAIHCAKRTFEINGLEGDFWRSNGLSEVSQRYKWIMTNPPFHTGVKTDYSVTEQFIQQVGNHMKRKGRMFMVANSFLNYPSLIEQTLKVCKTLHNDGKFSVYLAEESS